ncbi:MAG TPA: GDP-mannose 4,6-dehydratase [Anaerolineae bacterium]|nr:GDP-mannose 4,6-dehydratase [Anaerolineae bacterium]
MKALITGISGFVGSHLAEYLLQNTDWEVAGTVFGPYGNIADLCGTLELYPAELSRTDVVRFVLDQSQPDVIFHLAAQPLVAVSRQDPWGTLETNIRMQLNILEVVAQDRRECRVLVVGSSEEYGMTRPDDLPIDEDTPLRPLSAYAVSKVAQDLLGLQYHLTHHVHVVRARPFNHIGPRQGLGFVAPDLASQIAAIEAGLQEPVLRVGNLEARRDFCDVRDVVRAYVLLITSGKAGEVYNIGSGESHPIQEILDILLALSRVSVTVQQAPERMRPSEVPDVVCDASRLRAETGWQTTISFRQSMEDIMDYWRQRVESSAGQKSSDEGKGR